MMENKVTVFCEGVCDHVDMIVKYRPVSVLGADEAAQVPVSATCEFASTCGGFGHPECEAAAYKAMYGV